MPGSIILPFGPWQPDGMLFGEAGGLRLARNTIWRGGRYRAIPTVTRDTGATTGAPVRGVASLTVDGVTRPFFGTATTLHYFDTLGAPISLAGVAAVGATRWNWTTYGNTVIAADQANPVKASTSLGATANLITSVLTPRMRYVTTIKQHVFGARVDDGAAGAIEVSKFWWSARNNAANWQPGSDRAGYGYVRAVVGGITGVVGFEDFGVLFCERGVFRVDYIGGDSVWSLRQIAGTADGLPSTNEDSIAVQGFDVYYIGRGGPRAVLAGEQVVDIGEGSVSAYLTHAGLPSDLITAGFNVFGGASPRLPLVAFHYGGGPVDQPQYRMIVYNTAERAWSQITSPIAAAETPLGFVQSDVAGSLGISAVCKSGATEVSRDRFENATSQTITFRTPRIQAKAGFKSKLYAVRPLWSAMNSGTGAALGDGDVRVDVTIYRAELPQFAAATSFTLQNIAADMDSNGYLIRNLPIESQFFQFDVSFDPLLAASRTVFEELAGLEVVMEPGTAIL